MNCPKCETKWNDRKFGNVCPVCELEHVVNADLEQQLAEAQKSSAMWFEQVGVKAEALQSMTEQRDILARNAAAKSYVDFERNQEIERLKRELAQANSLYAHEQRRKLEESNYRLTQELLTCESVIEVLIALPEGKLVWEAAVKAAKGGEG
jgi:uncharacterized Zn finger protein (UPF0148 family)